MPNNGLRLARVAWASIAFGCSTFEPQTVADLNIRVDLIDYGVCDDDASGSGILKTTCDIPAGGAFPFGLSFAVDAEYGEVFHITQVWRYDEVEYSGAGETDGFTMMNLEVPNHGAVRTCGELFRGAKSGKVIVSLVLTGIDANRFSNIPSPPDQAYDNVILRRVFRFDEINPICEESD